MPTGTIPTSMATTVSAQQQVHTICELFISTRVWNGNITRDRSARAYHGYSPRAPNRTELNNLNHTKLSESHKW